MSSNVQRSSMEETEQDSGAATVCRLVENQPARNSEQPNGDTSMSETKRIPPKLRSSINGMNLNYILFSKETDPEVKQTGSQFSHPPQIENSSLALYNNLNSSNDHRCTPRSEPSAPTAISHDPHNSVGLFHARNSTGDNVSLSVGGERLIERYHCVSEFQPSPKHDICSEIVGRLFASASPRTLQPCSVPRLFHQRHHIRHGLDFPLRPTDQVFLIPNKAKKSCYYPSRRSCQNSQNHEIITAVASLQG